MYTGQVMVVAEIEVAVVHLLIISDLQYKGSIMAYMFWE